MARTWFRSVSLCACGLLLVLVHCDNPPSMAPNTSIFGEPEIVGGSTEDAASVVCQKLDSCGLLAASSTSGRGDGSSFEFGLSQHVGRAIYAQTSLDDMMPEWPDMRSAEKPTSPMEFCIQQLEAVMSQIEGHGVRVPWDSVAQCIAGADCSSFLSDERMQQLATQCAAMVGVSLPEAPDYPDDRRSPIRHDAGFGADAGVTPFDSGSGSDQEICDRATRKLQDCIEDLDCDALEGSQKVSCQALKENASSIVFEPCSGEVLESAKQIDGCTLNEICTCE